MSYLLAAFNSIWMFYSQQIGRAHVRTPVTLRCTLFPYTTLFRSLCRNDWKEVFRLLDLMPTCVLSTGSLQLNLDVLQPADRKSTRQNSSHTEMYSLSLHDALPIFVS